MSIEAAPQNARIAKTDSAPKGAWSRFKSRFELSPINQRRWDNF